MVALLPFEEVVGYLVKICYFNIHEINFVSIAAQDNLKESFLKAKPNDIIINTKLGILRKGIPSSLILIPIKHIRDFAMGNLFPLKFNCAKETEVQFEFH